MRERNDKIEGQFIISKDVAFRGLVAGSATVERGSTLHLYGTVTEDLTVEAGGSATIRGTVSGTVFNMGGQVEVFGRVGGVIDRDPAQTVIRVGV